MAKQMNLQTRIKVSLGGSERELRLDMNMLCDLEEQLGVSIMQQGSFWEKIGFKELRTMVYCMLYRESPRPSIEDVGDWLSEVNFTKLTSEIIGAWSNDVDTSDVSSGGGGESAPDPTQE